MQHSWHTLIGHSHWSISVLRQPWVHYHWDCRPAGVRWLPGFIETVMEVHPVLSRDRAVMLATVRLCVAGNSLVPWPLCPGPGPTWVFPPFSVDLGCISNLKGNQRCHQSSWENILQPYLLGLQKTEHRKTKRESTMIYFMITNWSLKDYHRTEQTSLGVNNNFI